MSSVINWKRHMSDARSYAKKNPLFAKKDHKCGATRMDRNAAHFVGNIKKMEANWTYQQNTSPLHHKIGQTLSPNRETKEGTTKRSMERNMKALHSSNNKEKKNYLLWSHDQT